MTSSRSPVKRHNKLDQAASSSSDKETSLALASNSNSCTNSASLFRVMYSGRYFSPASFSSGSLSTGILETFCFRQKSLPAEPSVFSSSCCHSEKSAYCTTSSATSAPDSRAVYLRPSSRIRFCNDQLSAHSGEIFSNSTCRAGASSTRQADNTSPCS